jgi:hypothetical protein
MKQGAEAISLMTKVFCSFIFFLLIFQEANSQENIPTNTWRTHLSYRSVQVIAASGEIAAATNSAVFFISGSELSTLTKENGLSDIGITALSYIGDYLHIGYENGNLDVLFETRSQTLIFYLKAIFRGRSKSMKYWSTRIMHIC